MRAEAFGRIVAGMSKMHGRCLCGAIRYEIGAESIDWQAYCECESCRRATGAPVVGWIGLARDGFSFTGEEPGRHSSSAGVIRSFCPRCGTPLTFSTEKRPEQIDVLAATLDDPRAFAPDKTFFSDESLGWPGLHLSLPKAD